MIRIFSLILILGCGLSMAQEAQEDELRKDLERTYEFWRKSILERNDLNWRKATAAHRQVAVKNLILSEKRKYPASIFDLPAPPPPLNGLTHLATLRKGPTAKSYYYGKIDFGLGGEPDNLMVLSYVGAAGTWKFDQVEYINLAALPEIRDQLMAGDIQYIKNTPELLPSGEVPPVPVEIKEPAFIAKVYAYCPTREVKVQVNQTSRHTFTSTKAAELVIGGVNDGRNEIQYTITPLEDEDPLDPLTIRVYLFSQVQGVKPVKIFEHLVPKGEKPQAFGKGEFVVTKEIRDKLLGR
ncbi:MAG: hypothetical protein R3242_00070 [Akkermansiaceae bacterium]|nr:hypothetical protein [Akkermansiaceae bacterium]